MLWPGFLFPHYPEKVKQNTLSGCDSQLAVDSEIGFPFLKRHVIGPGLQCRFSETIPTVGVLDNMSSFNNKKGYTE
jgi:hypothetical protein